MRYSHSFPPKNRVNTPLKILRIEIRHADGVLVTDPNEAIMKAVDGDLLHLAPLKDKVSDISQKPAVIYAADDLEVAVTPEELDRLVRHDLTPQEFLCLRDKYGVAFEWHDDFYDLDTGFSFQAVAGRAGRLTIT